MGLLTATVAATAENIGIDHDDYRGNRRIGDSDSHIAIAKMATPTLYNNNIAAEIDRIGHSGGHSYRIVVAITEDEVDVVYSK